jgi:hypothetical protein
VNEGGDTFRSETLTFSTYCTSLTVTTLAATNITPTTATLSKSVTGGGNITEQGFQYRVFGESSWISSTTGNLTGLIANTTYQFRAYATTANGTAYGNILTFTAATTGLDNIVANQLQIFPNPVSNDLFIKSESPIEKVEIYSAMGNLMIAQSSFTEKIEMQTLLSGVYFVKIHTGNKIITRKIVKK